jgi:hypothetical protein
LIFISSMSRSPTLLTLVEIVAIFLLARRLSE